MITTPAAIQTFPMRIGGADVASSQTMDVVLPYDGSVVAKVHTGDRAALALAVSTAREGARAMAMLANYERAELLERIGALVARDAEILARWITLETGKPIKEARLEASRAQDTLRAAAAAARDLHGEVVP